MTKPPRSTFFSIAITMTLIMLAFSLIANFLAGIGAFPHLSGMGVQSGQTRDVLSQITGLDDPNMNSIFLGVTTLTLVGVVLLAWALKTMIPIGLYFFGLIFWTSWIHMTSSFAIGGYIPNELLTIITIGAVFVFIGGIIGYIGGSG